MKRKLLLAVLFFIVSIPPFYLSGCTVFNSLGIPPTIQSNGGYVSSLSKATRKSDIYNKFNTVMYIRATYFDKSFERAYSAEYYNYYMRKPKMLNKKSNKYITLLVSVYTPEKSYNNLDSKRSIWMVYLVNNGGESLMPASIKPSQKKRVFLKKFFPYVTDWSRQYIIKFPEYFDKSKKKLFLNSSVKWIKLVVTGVNGKAVLKWNL
jgi:hypothetical protein